MSEHEPHWGERLVYLLALAARLEDEGYYNIAKLLRAAADSTARRTAYRLNLPHDLPSLSTELNTARTALLGFGCSPDLIAALERGKAALDTGRLPLYEEIGPVYVCRTCGHLVVGQTDAPCPTCHAWAATFLAFEPIYWMNNLEPLESIERLRQTPDEIAGLLTDLSASDLMRQPPDGGWSIQQVLAHLRDSQGLLDGRVRLMLAQDDPPLVSLGAADLLGDAAQPVTAGEIFERYRAERDELLDLLEDIPLMAWGRTGQHPEFGQVTIRQQASYFAGHELIHLRQLELLRRMNAGSV
ncbi:MAG: DUF664 domain-containing protein [Chloroflexi bacterium]|nr:DUF664 domain-containing protein [Chloroflexota bacterium]